MMKFAQILNILGKSVDSNCWKEICKHHEPKLLEQSSASPFWSASLYNLGVEFAFDKKTNRAMLIWLHGKFEGSFIPFSGDLPHGIAFKERQDEIQLKMGEPLWSRVLPLDNPLRIVPSQNSRDNSDSAIQEESSRTIYGYVMEPFSIQLYFDNDELGQLVLGFLNESNRINILKQQGAYAEAALRLEKQLKIKLAKPNDDHRNSITIFSDFLEIAECYQAAGDNINAELYYLDALKKSSPPLLNGMVVGDARKQYAFFLDSINRSNESFEQLILHFLEQEHHSSMEDRASLRNSILHLGAKLGITKSQCRQLLKVRRLQGY